MNLFSDNKRIIKNNFQILVFPTTIIEPKDKVVEQVSVDLCEVYEPYNNIKEETNPMLKSK